MNQVLIISGLDSTASAGILLDAHICKVFKISPICVLPSMTAQSYSDVGGHFFDEKSLTLQLQHIQNPPKIAKIGLLHNPKAVEIVGDFLRKHKIFAVVDTPIISSSGYLLVEDLENYIEALQDFIFPQTLLLTPNTQELFYFKSIENILQKGCMSVLLKGGHSGGSSCVDVLHTKNFVREFSISRLPFEENIRGTGCALSTCIACFLSQGFNVEDAILKSKNIVFNAILNSEKIDEKTRILHF